MELLSLLLCCLLSFVLWVFLGVSWSLCDEWYGAALSQNSEKKQARKSCEQKPAKREKKRERKQQKGWKMQFIVWDRLELWSETWLHTRFLHRLSSCPQQMIPIGFCLVWCGVWGVLASFWKKCKCHESSVGFFRKCSSPFQIHVCLLQCWCRVFLSLYFSGVMRFEWCGLRQSCAKLPSQNYAFPHTYWSSFYLWLTL